MSKVDEAIVEIDAALVAMAPAHEGLNDYNALDIKPETKAQVEAAIVQYDRRKLLLETAKAHLEALTGDGYPVLDIPDVNASVLADLQENAATIAAALAEFTSNAAASLGLTPNPPLPKT